MTRHLPYIAKHAIYVLRQHQIHVKLLAEAFAVDERTIKRISANEPTEDDRGTLGRPSFWTEEQKEEFGQEVLRQRWLSISQLWYVVQSLGLPPLSERQLRRILHQLGIFKFKDRFQPAHGPKWEDKRLQAARELTQLGIDTLVFVDEKQLGTTYRPQFHYARVPDDDIYRVKIPSRPTVNVIGAVGMSSKPPLYRPRNRILTAAAFWEAIRSHLLPQIARDLPQGFVLVMDNAPIHSAMPADLLNAYPKGRIFQISAYSPDMNQIEQVWHELDTKALDSLEWSKKYSAEDLFEMASDYWARTPFANHFDHYQQTLARIVQAEGRWVGE